MELYPALKAVIEKDGKFLILKRSDNEDVAKNEWDIPGGAIRFVENPIDALKREIKEECGLDVDVIKPLRLWTFYKNSGKTQIFGVTLLCKYKEGTIILSKEHTAYKWIDADEINDFKIHKGIKEDIKIIYFRRRSPLLITLARQLCGSFRFLTLLSVGSANSR